MKATVKKVSEETKKAIVNYLQLGEKFKNSYFWSSPSHAASRRKMESDNSFEYNGDGLHLVFRIECSCKNVYVRKSVTIDGEPKTAAALKKYIK